MIDLLRGRSLVFETRLSPDEITRRLEREVAPPAWRIYENRSQLFVGTFTDGRFRMVRLFRGKNSFRTLIEGQLSPSPGGARIDVRLRMHPAVMIVCTLLVIVGGIFAAIALSEALAGGYSLRALIMVLAFPVAGLGMLFLLGVEASKATQLLAEVFDAKPIRSAGR
jgi:hypothetical protein